MKRSAVVAATLLVAVLGYLLWQRVDIDSRTFRLKATATILVDGVERTGTSVQEYRLEKIYPALNGFMGAWRLMVRGEAIRIDVPGEEPIYVLLSENSVFDNCATRNKGQDEVKASLLQLTRCDLQTFPRAVRFDGAGDYAKAIPVHFEGRDWNGYRFLSMSFERTQEPLTEGFIPVQLWTYGGPPVEVPLGKRTAVLSTYFKMENF